MKKLLGIEFVIRDSWLIPNIHFLFFSFKLNFIKIKSNLIFHWENTFKKYFDQNDVQRKASALKDKMDEISCIYINRFMELFPYANKLYFKKTWTDYDDKLIKESKEFAKTFKQPFADILTVNPFYYLNIYGLRDLPKEVFNQIDGKIIIDGGALNGDSALMLHHYFPKSEVHAFEPLSINYNVMEKFLAKDNCGGKIIPVKKGLGDKEKIVQISFNDVEEAQIVTIDNTYQNSQTPIGLIKLDTEGFESFIIEGAKETIKKDKPVLTIAIYHTPEDFFDLKEKIQKLNPDYKFMIRRSEITLPMADLVLIAY